MARPRHHKCSRCIVFHCRCCSSDDNISLFRRVNNQHLFNYRYEELSLATLWDNSHVDAVDYLTNAISTHSPSNLGESGR